MRAARGPRNAQAYRLGISGELGQVGRVRPSEWPLWIKIAASVTLFAVVWVWREIGRFLIDEFGWWIGFAGAGAILTAVLLNDWRRRRRGLPPL